MKLQGREKGLIREGDLPFRVKLLMGLFWGQKCRDFVATLSARHPLDFGDFSK